MNSYKRAPIDKNQRQNCKIDCSKEFELTKTDFQVRKFTEANRDERYEKYVVVNTQHIRQRQRISSYNSRRKSQNRHLEDPRQSLRD